MFKIIYAVYKHNAAMIIFIRIPLNKPLSLIPQAMANNDVPTVVFHTVNLKR